MTRTQLYCAMPCPPPGDLPNPRTEPVSLRSPALAGGFFTTRATWKLYLTQLVETKRKNQRRQWHPTPVLLPGKSHGRRSLWATIRGVAKSRTQLSNFTFTFHFHALEKEMATHSSILAWRIPGTGAWWAAVYGATQSWTRLTWLSSSSKRKNGAGTGNPLQPSCLENSMDRGAWWAAVHGVAKSWARLSDWATEWLHFLLSCIGEGNGNPLQCSCLENPIIFLFYA